MFKGCLYMNATFINAIQIMYLTVRRIYMAIRIKGMETTTYRTNIE